MPSLSKAGEKKIIRCLDLAPVSSKILRLLVILACKLIAAKIIINGPKLVSRLSQDLIFC